MNQLLKKHEQLKKIQFTVPSTINLYRILNDRGLKSELKHIPYYYYILYLIHRDQKFTKDFVRLNMKSLEDIITCFYTLDRIIKNLVSFGIIEINNSYQVNGFSKGYKIMDKYMRSDTNPISFPYHFISSTSNPSIPLFSYLTLYPSTASSFSISFSTLNQNNLYYNLQSSPSPFMLFGFDLDHSERLDIIECLEDKKFLDGQIDRYKKIRNKIGKTMKNRFEKLASDPKQIQYKYIEKNIKNTTVDKEAYNFINTLLEKNVKLKPDQMSYMKNGQKISYWKKERFMETKNAKEWIEDVKMIESGMCNIKCPDNTRRLYSTITSCPGLLRRFLRYGDKKLYYIDIRNSQPFLFLFFVLKEFKGKNLPADVLLYIDWVCSGMLYDNLMLKMNKTDITGKDTSKMNAEELWDYETKRAAFKIDFFARIFFSTEKKPYDERKAFNELFPSVSKIITKMKKNDHKKLPLQMSKFEASLILDRVFYMLAGLYPHSYATPIHDGIICEENIKDIVVNLILDEIEYLIGYKPKLKVMELNEADYYTKFFVGKDCAPQEIVLTDGITEVELINSNFQSDTFVRTNIPELFEASPGVTNEVEIRKPEHRNSVFFELELAFAGN